MDSQKFQYEGMKWLHEMEMLNHPQLINNIKFNVLMASKRIKEVELLIYRENKSMLVLLELSWFGRNFSNKKKIFEEVQEILSGLLPSFRFRVTDDPHIMTLAVAVVKKALTGGTNENTSNSSDNVSKSVSATKNDLSAGNQAVIGTASDSKADQEKQPEAEAQLRDESVTSDPDKK